jgi:hypothetical protein
MSPERLVVIRPDETKFTVSTENAARLAVAFLTDTDCHAVKIGRWETTRAAWKEINRLAHPEDYPEIDRLGELGG